MNAEQKQQHVMSVNERAKEGRKAVLYAKRKYRVRGLQDRFDALGTIHSQSNDESKIIKLMMSGVLALMGNPLVPMNKVPLDVDGFINRVDAYLRDAEGTNDVQSV